MQFLNSIYEGNFVVTEIYPNAYTYRGSVTTEIRARVVDYECRVNNVPESALETTVNGALKVYQS